MHMDISGKFWGDLPIIPFNSLLRNAISLGPLRKKVKISVRKGVISLLPTMG